MVPFFHYQLLVFMKNAFSTKFDTPWYVIYERFEECDIKYQISRNSKQDLTFWSINDSINESGDF